MKQLLHLIAQLLGLAEPAPQMRAQRIPIRVERHDDENPTRFYR